MAAADHTHDRPPVPSIGKARLETLVDGVFAIAMTLLVLEIRVPEGASENVLAGLGQLWPSFLAYALSFANLGVFWVGHHSQFDAIRRTNRTSIWLNIGFLVFVSLIPFSTALLAAHTGDRAAVVFYGANLLAAGLMLYANWRYATDHHRLTDHNVPDALVRLGGLRVLTGVVALTVAIAAAMVDTRISLAIFLLIPAYYVFPGGVDKLWARAA
ncbi:MAG TPA: TMEM175 family protein [Candidatus Thermoplasmatota archaeon]|nr:TMEM175 family protein [Candidatus Thermoplasmatota archaeon]